MKKKYNRNFGILISIIFTLFFIKDYYQTSSSNLYFLFSACLALLIAIIKPRWLHTMSFLWFNFGVILSRIVSPIILIILFYFLITPISLILKIFRIESRKKKFLIKKKSFWIDRLEQPKNMNRQF